MNNESAGRFAPAEMGPPHHLAEAAPADRSAVVPQSSVRWREYRSPTAATRRIQNVSRMPHKGRIMESERQHALAALVSSLAFNSSFVIRALSLYRICLFAAND